MSRGAIFRRAAPVLAGVVAALGGLALTAGAQEAVHVEPVLGGHVRPGRPFVVRTTGPVMRLRAADGPWSLPRGAAGNEFVVHTRSAGLGPMSVEVDTGSGTRSVDLVLRTLPPDGPLAVDLGGGDGAPPTIPEAWAPFDRLPEAPSGWPAAAREAHAVASLSRTANGRHPADPSGMSPGLTPFRVAASAAAAAPRLPTDVVLASLLAAATSVLLLVLVRRRPAGARVLWAAAPVVGFLAWAGLSGALPGAVRGTALVLADDRFALVLVRVETVHAARASFALPPGAEDATLLRFAPEDHTASSVEIGDRVRMDLGKGQHRLLAYRVPLAEPPPPRLPVGQVPAGLAKLLDQRGWRAAGRLETVPDVLPRAGDGVRILAGAALGVRSRDAPGK